MQIYANCMETCLVHYILIVCISRTGRKHSICQNVHTECWSSYFPFHVLIFGKNLGGEGRQWPCPKSGLPATFYFDSFVIQQTLLFRATYRRNQGYGGDQLQYCTQIVGSINLIVCIISNPLHIKSGLLPDWSKLTVLSSLRCMQP